MEAQEKKGNVEFQDLIDTGERLMQEINLLLLGWPKEGETKLLSLYETPTYFKEQVRNLEIDVRRWFNTIQEKVLPVILFDRHQLLDFLNNVVSGIRRA